MDNPIAMEATSEYVKTTDIDVLMGKIVSSLQPRIEAIVQDSVRKAIEEFTAKTDEKIFQAKGEIQGEFNAKLGQHIEQERKERHSDIDAINKRVASVGDETSQKLGEFSKTVIEAKQAVELATTEIKGWNNVLTSTRQQYEDTRRDIERLETESDNSIKTLTSQAEQLSALSRTIHGGDGDTPSVFSELKAIRKQGEQTGRTVEAALQVARDVSNRQDKLEQESQQEKERRALPGKIAATFTKKVVGIPYFWLTVILLVLIIASVYMPPESYAQLFEFATKFFSAP